MPVSSFALNLPIGPHSALAANGDLCTTKLIDADDDHRAERREGQTEHEDLALAGCGVQDPQPHACVGTQAACLKVRTFGAGRISGKGTDLRTVSRRLSKAAQ